MSWGSALEFWNSNQMRKDQHFYTGFSIFTTMLQDYLDADILSRNRISEWSVVAYYYALMHSFRLYMLLAHGDFPTSHSTLPRLLKGQDASNECDWMGKPFQNEVISNRTVNRMQLIEWFAEINEDLRDWDVWLKNQGEFLDELRVIRNKLNYEGLISAHRALPPLVTHTRVSKTIQDTIEVCRNHTSNAILLSAQTLHNFIVKFDTDDRWKSYLSWNSDSHNVITVINDGVQERHRPVEGIQFLKHLFIEASPGCPQVIEEAISKLDFPSHSEDISKSQDVMNNISIESFSEKDEQFRKLENSLRKLTQASARLDSL